MKSKVISVAKLHKCFNCWKNNTRRAISLLDCNVQYIILCERLVANQIKRQCRDENFMYIDYLEEKKLLDCTAFAISSEVGEQVLLSFSNIFNFYQI